MNEVNRKTLKPRAPQQGAPQMRIRPMAPILPPSNIQGNALIVVIAIMAFLACLTLGAVSMVRATAASWPAAAFPPVFACFSRWYGEWGCWITASITSTCCARSAAVW